MFKRMYTEISLSSVSFLGLEIKAGHSRGRFPEQEMLIKKRVLLHDRFPDERDFVTANFISLISW